MMLQKTYFRESPNGLYNVADHFTPTLKTNKKKRTEITIEKNMKKMHKTRRERNWWKRTKMRRQRARKGDERINKQDWNNGHK
jgi:predicted ATPase